MQKQLFDDWRLAEVESSIATGLWRAAHGLEPPMSTAELAALKRKAELAQSSAREALQEALDRMKVEASALRYESSRVAAIK